MMKRFLCIAISAAVLLGVVAQQPAMTDIKKQKKEAQQDIKKTSQKIKENKNETAKTLADLNRITSEIDASNKKIADLNLQIADINVRIHGVNQEIEMLDSTVGRLQSNYLRAIKKIRMHRVSGNKMMFLLSSESFHQAYRRMRYLREFSRWREAQTRQIKAARRKLEQQKHQLVALQNERSKTINTINSTKLSLEGKRAEQNRIVKQLREEKGDLMQILQEQQRKLNQLDQQLNRLIEAEQRAAAERARAEAEKRRKAEEEKARKAEEARKADEARLKKEREEREAELRRNKEQQRREAEKKKKEELKRKQKELEKEQERLRKEQERIDKEREEARKREEQRRSQPAESDEDIRMDGNFESNKGKLPVPVTGSYRIVKRFGRHKHPVLEYVTIDSPGIEIEAAASAAARSVFAGTVTSIYKVDNEYNYVVLVKHGSYTTVYAGLKTLNVKKGDSVKAGQSLGSLFPDVNDTSHAVLHFQVRKGTTKLDPQAWIK